MMAFRQMMNNYVGRGPPCLSLGIWLSGQPNGVGLPELLYGVSGSFWRNSQSMEAQGQKGEMNLGSLSDLLPASPHGNQV